MISNNKFKIKIGFDEIPKQWLKRQPVGPNQAFALMISQLPENKRAPTAIRLFETSLRSAGEDVDKFINKKLKNMTSESPTMCVFDGGGWVFAGKL